VSARKSICVVVSSIWTAEAVLLEQMAAMTKFYDVSLVANCDDKDRLRKQGLDVDVLYVPMNRNPSPFKDLMCLITLARLFKKRRFDVVHSVTPKAGLLGMLAARLAGVPARVHTFTGQVWATRTGMGRTILKSMDRILAWAATDVLADSRSQLDFLRQQKVLAPDRGAVLANGSIRGVDASRFKPDGSARERIRRELSIPDHCCVFLFVGRLNPDKGVLTLAQAFSQVARTHPDTLLLIVGPDEAGMRPKIEQTCNEFLPRLRFVGNTSVPETYMAASDVLCLPSRREGFGNVVIEAAAAGLPAIASRIYGLTDAMVDGTTGLLHEPGDSSALASAMSQLADSPALRRTLSTAGRERVLHQFASENVIDALQFFYQDLLGSASTGGFIHAR